MATALSPYANTTITFLIPSGALAEDEQTGNFNPVFTEVSVRAFLKFSAVTEMMYVGATQVETVFTGRAVDTIPGAVKETSDCRVLVDGDSQVWTGIVRNLRGPYGPQGINTLVTPLAGESIQIYAWRQP